MHYFLTGQIQIGKSTAIKRWLDGHKQLKLGGFVSLSHFGTVEGAMAEVQLCPAGQQTGRRIGLRLGDGKYEAYPEVFDEYGPSLLEGDCDILLMDEIGFMESNSPKFSAAIMRALDGSTQILGVIRAKHTALLDAIRAHPNVCVIEVTELNRDYIPLVLEGLLSHRGSPALGGLIVSAGLSSRMGGFKPLLPLGGKTMLQHAIENMRRAGAEKIIVVTGHRADDLRPIIQALDAYEVYNPDYASTQMFDSVKLGLEHLADTCGRIMMTPVDNPAISDHTFRAVLDSSALLSRPEYSGRGGHPMVFSSALAPYLMAYSGGGGMRGALDICGIAVASVPVDDPGIDMDADTPEEYLRLCRYWEETHN